MYDITRFNLMRRLDTGLTDRDQTGIGQTFGFCPAFYSAHCREILIESQFRRDQVMLGSDNQDNFVQV